MTTATAALSVPRRRVPAAALAEPGVSRRAPAATEDVLTQPRVFIVEGRPLLRSGLARLAGRALGATALALADLDQAAAARRFGDGAPRVLLLGLRAGEDPGSLVAAARRIAPIVICVPERGDPTLIRSALGAGADGYVRPESLTAEVLREAVEAIETGAPVAAQALEPVRGHDALAITARCHEVLRSLADGLHDHEIAERLGISTSSVRKHVANAQARLQARTRTQAVALAVRDGLL